MDPIISTKIVERIGKLDKAGKLKDRKIILGPANQYTYGVAVQLIELGYNIHRIIDNNASYNQKTLCDISVCTPDDLVLDDCYVFLISASFFSDIKSQLIDLGHETCMILEMADFKVGSALLPQRVISTEVLSNDCDNLLHKLRSDNKHILIFPYNSLGDIFIIGMYRNYIKKKYGTKYVITLTGNACASVASWFDLNVQIVTEKENESLLVYHHIINPKDVDVLHYHFYHKDTWNGNPIWHGVHFLTMYKELLFDGQSPLVSVGKEATEKLYKGKGEEHQERIVVVSPYAKSMIALPPFFWEALVNELIMQGNDVYTNCSGPLEVPILGTKVLRVSFSELVEKLKGGVFIGIRSGLNDILSFTETKKIILYPGEYEKSLYSLDVWKQNNIREIVYKSIQCTIDEVLEVM